MTKRESFRPALKPPSLREVARRSRDGRSEQQSLEKLELMKKALMQEYFG